MPEEERIEIPEPVRYSLPQPIPQPEEVEEEQAVEDLSDLTSVSKADVLGKADGNSEEDDMEDLWSLSEEDEEDLFGVDREDVMGTPPKPKAPPAWRFRRVVSPYQQPPTSLRGVEY